MSDIEILEGFLGNSLPERMQDHQPAISHLAYCIKALNKRKGYDLAEHSRKNIKEALRSLCPEDAKNAPKVIIHHGSPIDVFPEHRLENPTLCIYYEIALLVTTTEIEVPGGNNKTDVDVATNISRLSIPLEGKEEIYVCKKGQPGPEYKLSYEGNVTATLICTEAAVMSSDVTNWSAALSKMLILAKKRLDPGPIRASQLPTSSYNSAQLIKEIYSARNWFASEDQISREKSRLEEKPQEVPPKKDPVYTGLLQDYINGDH